VFVPGGFLSQCEMLKQSFQHCNLNSERPFDTAGKDSRQNCESRPKPESKTRIDMNAANSK